MPKQFGNSPARLAFIHSLGKKTPIFILGEISPQPVHSADLNSKSSGCVLNGSPETGSPGSAGGKQILFGRFYLMCR
jgi:hypothetical protein